jgi:translation initiation factor 2 alpha subunit (eIF-2alpha)
MIHFIHSLILEISAKDMEIRGSDPLGWKSKTLYEQFQWILMKLFSDLMNVFNQASPDNEAVFFQALDCDLSFLTAFTF